MSAALIIALIGSSITVAQNAVFLYDSIKTAGKAPVVVAKTTNKHVIHPVYAHVLKPIGKEIAK